MTTPATDNAAFRIRSRNDSGKLSKDYVRSYDLFAQQRAQQRDSDLYSVIGSLSLFMPLCRRRRARYGANACTHSDVGKQAP
jgi:hypothetical protein